MGSGKSTIARLLAQKLQITYKDLDEIIENDAQMTINTIFKNKGELHFRKKEHQILKELMSSEESFVLSLGGGTPCYANNDEFLNGPSIVSFYLKVPIEILSKRLINEKETRPLIADKNAEELKDFIAQHLFERSHYYHKATNTIDVAEKSPEEILAEIELTLI